MPDGYDPIQPPFQLENLPYHQLALPRADVSPPEKPPVPSSPIGRGKGSGVTSFALHSAPWWLERRAYFERTFPRGLSERSQLAADLAAYSGDESAIGYAETRDAYRDCCERDKPELRALIAAERRTVTAP